MITYTANHKIGKTQQLAKNKLSGNKSYYETEDPAHPNILDDDSDLLVCETKDLVKVGVRADVFYSIVDPEKCIQTLNTGKSITSLHLSWLRALIWKTGPMFHTFSPMFQTLQMQMNWKVSYQTQTRLMTVLQLKPTSHTPFRRKLLYP